MEELNGEFKGKLWEEPRNTSRFSSAQKYTIKQSSDGKCKSPAMLDRNPGIKLNFSSINILSIQRNVSLVLICRQSTCDMAAGTACDTSPTYKDTSPPATRNIAVFTAGMPAKLNSIQLRRHTGGKDWHGPCCRRLPFSYRNGVAGSTGSYVAGSSSAYENHTFRIWK